LRQLAAELVRGGAEVLATWGPAAASALKKETDKIPIVFMSIADPISKGFVASLARPGSNLTGVADATEQYSGKRLELLKEAVPRARRFGVLMNERIMRIANRLESARKEFTETAHALHAELKWFSASSEDELERVFDDIKASRVDALVVLGDPGVFWIHRKMIADTLAALRLPAMRTNPETITVGGLMSYGPDLAEAARRGAAYVDKIIRGARPENLPVEQPMRLKLTINLPVARALGLTIPPSLLLRADQVIE
jgi:putative ABC transport system substrate-binding protein